MSWLTSIPALAAARRGLGKWTRGVWSRDRAALRGWPALANRIARIAIRTVRGVFVHHVGLQAAALTYYTVFAMVPTLVVVLWILRALDRLPVISAELPANVRIPTGDQLLHAALGKILEAVNRTSEVTTGVVGLAVLLFAVTKMFAFTARALHIIAGSGRRAPRFSRLLGYVALMLVAPALLALSGLALALIRGSHATPLARVLGVFPELELGVGLALGAGALWLAVTLLYASAARAALPFSSAAVGGAVAALALPVVFWVFANFQIGAAETGALSSGAVALPVFLLWVFSSWYAVLVGAEIAVGHHLDRVLVHGAAAFRLDCAGQREAGVAIVVHLAEMAGGVGPAAASEDELARRLRLPPAIVHGLCLRLVERGFLARGGGGFTLGCDPAATPWSAVAEAVDRDPRAAERLP